MSRAVAFDDGHVNLTSNFPNRQPMRAKTLQRGKTLSRPDRFVEPTPLLTPVIRNTSNKKHSLSTWEFTSKVITCWAPGFLLQAFGKKDPQVQQAWREKITLCFIALLLGCFVGFLTVGLSAVLCPSTLGGSTPADFLPYKQITGLVGILGWSFNITESTIVAGGPNFYTLANQAAGMDVTNYFMRTNADSPACNGLKYAIATTQPCFPDNGYQGCPLPQLNVTTFQDFKISNTSKHVGYDWVDLANLKNYFVIDGNVLNLDPYMAAHPEPISGDAVDLALRTVLFTTNLKGGKDATRLFFHREDLKMSIPCLEQKYYAGHIDKDTPGCFVAQMFLYFSLIVILGIVMTRFAMAMIFNWFVSAKLAKNPKGLPRRGGSIPKAMKMNEVGAELYTVCLVTAYSEEEDGIRTTVESLAGTDYPDDRKLILIIADGIITGSGQTRTTPDICIGLLEKDPRFGTPQAMSYIAVASGSKQHNMAKVYAGHYTRVKGHRTPMIVIVKTGTPEEAKGGKPGNRGKRDSQLILMNFFQHVTFNDRMTPLDYDLFRKCHMLMGVTPDFFEVVLMVDADTKVYKDSLVCLVNCLQNDQLIIGVCGETRIANKRQSWVTMIQVFEYYISHHLGKGFESVFGGVTCLPGCFCCYRLKTRRNGEDDWVPILAKPEIVKEYSQNTVESLHQKNLLLLGEDRFLSTLMLRNFPTRKMMFCPQAVCRTVVPDEFRVLLSQRRRWINSTIHNLMELVLVRNLCGTFCFSMQFVVFMELIGTTVLPVALLLTYSLIINIIMNPPKHLTEALPVALLFVVLIFPGILILVTTRKVVYVAWMLIYLLALPVWNLVLPVYAYWHFDDFSWGETRKVEGDTKDDHGKKEGQFDASSVPLRRWEEWERSRLKKIKREEKRRRELAASFGAAKFYEQNSNGDYDQSVRSQSPHGYYERSSESPNQLYRPMSTATQNQSQFIPNQIQSQGFNGPKRISSRPSRQISMVSSYYGGNQGRNQDELEGQMEWNNIRRQDNQMTNNINNNVSQVALLLSGDSPVLNGQKSRVPVVANDEMHKMLDDGWGEDQVEVDDLSLSSESPLNNGNGHPLAHSPSPPRHTKEISNSGNQGDVRNGQSTAIGYFHQAHRRNQSGGKGPNSYR